MKLKLLYLCTLVLTFATGYAQNPVWSRAAGVTIAKADRLDRASVPSASYLFSLDIAALKQQLQGAPMRLSGATSNVIIAFPNGDGQLKNFRVYEAPVMQPGLQAKHQDMKSYIGTGVDNPAETIRFSVTLFGLHNMMFSPGETSYIDPYSKNLQYYMVYKRKDLTTTLIHNCGFDSFNPHSAAKTAEVNEVQTTLTDDNTFRVYRLAMSNTVEYAAFHINAAGLNNGTLAQKKDAVQAAMVVTITRVDGVYERDFAVTMQFVDNNQDLLL
jgi:hypothetical protein